jgi:serine/threonine protein kinase
MLPAGARLGHYEVIALLGEGGMGQVYRARDHKLGREAQVLASLNHTGIAAIYGFEDPQ